MNTDIIREFSMLPPGTSVLCALSGGADSMCLLSLLMELRQELSLRVCAAHYEHGIRGGESLRDARFAEEYCREKGIEFICEHGRAEDYAAEHSLSTEEAARELRYDFLNRAAQRLGCSKIATAHNADDNAETLIFNLCRGSGGAGLRGIPPVRGNIIRPLLGCTRAEIEEYLSERGIPHVEDSSNASDDYSRNLIRHKVMPVLRELNGSFSHAAGRASALLRQDEECLGSLAETYIKENYNEGSLSTASLLSQPRAVSGRVIRRLCPANLSLAQVNSVLEFCASPGLGYLNLPKITLRREQGRLYFTPAERLSLEERTLEEGKWQEIPEAGIRIRSVSGIKGREINGLFKNYCFKYTAICGKIIVTGRQSGDNIRPIGRNCSKSLKKLFTEAGYTQHQRDITPVIRDEKGVLAVYGLAVDQRVKAAPGDKILRIEIESLQGDTI